MRALKRRLGHKNPNVQLLALSVSTNHDTAMLTLTCPSAAYRRLHQEWRRHFLGGGGVTGVYGQSRLYFEDARFEYRCEEQDIEVAAELGACIRRQAKFRLCWRSLQNTPT